MKVLMSYWTQTFWNLFNVYTHHCPISLIIWQFELPQVTRFIMAWSFFFCSFCNFFLQLLHPLSFSKQLHSDVITVTVVSEPYQTNQLFAHWFAVLWLLPSWNLSSGSPSFLNMGTVSVTSTSTRACECQPIRLSQSRLDAWAIGQLEALFDTFFAKEVAKKKLCDLRFCFMTQKESFYAPKHNLRTVFFTFGPDCCKDSVWFV